ncbi:helix-turn-helix domain-containing protein [Paraburkholderia sp.]|uniref:helix-turn-helix domain-containing protein n=1 Tax=Paraburkholderia sp. TaxID=1926495 RepID=UPI003C7E2267
MLRKDASTPLTERIEAAARWLEAHSDQPISIVDAARVAAMSQRNFLRRFKLEVGLSPSDYLLKVRLDMSCRFLVETSLPVDKIARRCGIGNGGCELSPLRSQTVFGIKAPGTFRRLGAASFSAYRRQ